jgi:hypothetical protein
VPGTFTYAPAAGAVPAAGQAQTLTVTFTPNDTADYTSATDTVLINVNPAPLTVTGVTANPKEPRKNNLVKLILLVLVVCGSSAAWMVQLLSKGLGESSKPLL